MKRFFPITLLLLLLSHFSHVWLCTSPSLGFSRQGHWSGLPFPSPMHKSESEVAQSCPTLQDPMGCSLPGSSVHGICQARVLEWGVIAFSVLLHYHWVSFKNQGLPWWSDGLRLHAPNCREPRSIPGQGTRSHMSQLKESTCCNQDLVQLNK